MTDTKLEWAPLTSELALRASHKAYLKQVFVFMQYIFADIYCSYVFSTLFALYTSMRYYTTVEIFFNLAIILVNYQGMLTGSKKKVIF